MAVMEAAKAGPDGPAEVQERLKAYASEVLAEAVNRPVQVENGELYLRGLLEQAPRKSLEPMVERLGGDGDYQSLQQFVADSPWDPAAVVRAVAERICPEIGVEAWVLDDTGFPEVVGAASGHAGVVKMVGSGIVRLVGEDVGVAL